MHQFSLSHCPGHAPLSSLHRVCVRIVAASSSAAAVPCVDVALNFNSSHVSHETRTPWDWILRLPPLNVCVDAVFTATGFLLLPMLYRTFRSRGPAARMPPHLTLQFLIFLFLNYLGQPKRKRAVCAHGCGRLRLLTAADSTHACTACCGCGRRQVCSACGQCGARCGCVQLLVVKRVACCCLMKRCQLFVFVRFAQPT